MSTDIILAEFKRLLLEGNLMRENNLFFVAIIDSKICNCKLLFKNINNITVIDTVILTEAHRFCHSGLQTLLDSLNEECHSGYFYLCADGSVGVVEYWPFEVFQKNPDTFLFLGYNLITKHYKEIQEITDRRDIILSSDDDVIHGTIYP